MVHITIAETQIQKVQSGVILLIQVKDGNIVILSIVRQFP